MSYLGLLNAVAQVIGGTQPDPVNKPYWFSGRDSLDSSGLAGLAGCYSLPIEGFGDTPVGLVLPASWRPLERFPTQGHKFREDTLNVRIMVGHDDLQSQMSRLVNFADLVPTAFDTHMGLLGQAGVLTSTCANGRFLEVDWPPVYLALEFVLNVQRSIPVTYTA